MQWNIFWPVRDDLLYMCHHEVAEYLWHHTLFRFQIHRPNISIDHVTVCAKNTNADATGKAVLVQTYRYRGRHELGTEYQSIQGKQIQKNGQRQNTWTQIRSKKRQSKTLSNIRISGKTHQETGKERMEAWTHRWCTWRIKYSRRE